MAGSSIAELSTLLTDAQSADAKGTARGSGDRAAQLKAEKAAQALLIIAKEADPGGELASASFREK